MGDDCIVAHSAVVHGCTVGNQVLVGAGAIIFDGCVVEDGALIGIGAVVTPNTHVPAWTVMLGVPAQPSGRRSPEPKREGEGGPQFYIRLASRYLAHDALRELP